MATKTATVLVNVCMVKLMFSIMTHLTQVEATLLTLLEPKNSYLAVLTFFFLCLVYQFEFVLFLCHILNVFVWPTVLCVCAVKGTTCILCQPHTF